MTVITKAIGEKKPADKMEQPLVCIYQDNGLINFYNPFILNNYMELYIQRSLFHFYFFKCNFFFTPNDFFL